MLNVQCFKHSAIIFLVMASSLPGLNVLALLPASHFFHLKTTCSHDSCYAYNAHSLLIAQHSRRNMHQHLINLVHISIHWEYQSFKIQ